MFLAQVTEDMFEWVGDVALDAEWSMNRVKQELATLPKASTSAQCDVDLDILTGLCFFCDL